MSSVPQQIRDRYPEAQLPLLEAFGRATLEKGYDIQPEIVGWLNSLDLEPIVGLPISDDAKFVHTRFMLLDILISWLTNLKYLSLLELTCSKLTPELKNYDISVHRVVHAFSDKFIGDLLGIRSLMLRSLDAQARQLCRSVSESIDVFYVATTNSTVRDAYMCANTPELANKFYFENVAKGRARKAFRRAVRGQGHDHPNDIWLANEERLFSGAVHPTQVPFLTKSLVDEDHFEIGGTYPTLAQSSRRTLRFISLRALSIPAVSVVAKLESAISSTQHSHRFFEEFGMSKRREFHKYGGLALFLAWDFMGRAEEEGRPF